VWQEHCGVRAEHGYIVKVLSSLRGKNDQSRKSAGLRPRENGLFALLCFHLDQKHTIGMIFKLLLKLRESLIST
jgi:hypothetical protein